MSMGNYLWLYFHFYKNHKNQFYQNDEQICANPKLQVMMTSLQIGHRANKYGCIYNNQTL